MDLVLRELVVGGIEVGELGMGELEAGPLEVGTLVVEELVVGTPEDGTVDDSEEDDGILNGLEELIGREFVGEDVMRDVVVGCDVVGEVDAEKELVGTVLDRGKLEDDPLGEASDEYGVLDVLSEPPGREFVVEEDAVAEVVGVLDDSPVDPDE